MNSTQVRLKPISENGRSVKDGESSSRSLRSELFLPGLANTKKQNEGKTRCGGTHTHTQGQTPNGASPFAITLLKVLGTTLGQNWIK